MKTSIRPQQAPISNTQLYFHIEPNTLIMHNEAFCTWLHLARSLSTSWLPVGLIVFCKLNLAPEHILRQYWKILVNCIFVMNLCHDIPMVKIPCQWLLIVEQAQLCNKLPLRRHLLQEHWAWPRRLASRRAFGPTRLFPLFSYFNIEPCDDISYYLVISK